MAISNPFQEIPVVFPVVREWFQVKVDYKPCPQCGIVWTERDAICVDCEEQIEERENNPLNHD